MNVLGEEKYIIVMGIKQASKQASKQARKQTEINRAEDSRLNHVLVEASLTP